MRSIRVLLLAAALPAAALFSQDAAPPFTVEQMFQVISAMKTIGEETVVDMVVRRGVDFRMTDAVRRKLQQAGAGPALVEAIARASEERLRLKAQAQAATQARKVVASIPEPDEGVALPPPFDAAGRAEFVERAREQALSYTKGLPSFICLQVTSRHVDPRGTGEFFLADTINARLSYDQHRENYQVVTVNNRLTDVSYEKLGGAVSTGEFGSLLSGIYERNSAAAFQWVRQGVLRNRAVEVFDYEVVKDKSQWHLQYGKADHYIPAYKGRLWIDRQTAQTLRLSMAAIEIPGDFPIRVADTTLDYNYIPISGMIFLLPIRAVVHMADGARTVTRNEIEFRLYRKFTTDVTISFDTEEDADKNKPDKNKIKPPEKPKQ